MTQLGELMPGSIDALRSITLDSVIDDGVVQAVLNAPGLDHELGFLDKPGQSLGPSVRGKPFDFEFTARHDFGAPAADRSSGTMELAVSSASIPFDSDAESTYNAAGVGVLYRPTSGAAFVRVAPYLSSRFKWHNESTLEVARNRGELRVFARERGGRTVLDSSTSLWNDGTSWYEEHGDDVGDVFSDSNSFPASSSREYEVWFWFNSSIDFNGTSGAFDFGSSKASNSLFAELGWIVFEEFPI